MWTEKTAFGVLKPLLPPQPLKINLKQWSRNRIILYFFIKKKLQLKRKQRIYLIVKHIFFLFSISSFHILRKRM
jgi:hypothetical protein